MLLINDISFPPFVSLAVSPIENYLSPLPATWKWYFFSYLINFNLTDGYPVTFESKIVENNIFQRYNLMTIWSRVRLDSRIQIWLIVKRPFRLAHDWRWNSKGGPLLLLLLVSDSSRHIPFHRTIDALRYLRIRYLYKYWCVHGGGSPGSESLPSFWRGWTRNSRNSCRPEISISSRTILLGSCIIGAEITSISFFDTVISVLFIIIVINFFGSRKYREQLAQC